MDNGVLMRYCFDRVCVLNIVHLRRVNTLIVVSNLWTAGRAVCRVCPGSSLACLANLDDLRRMIRSSPMSILERELRQKRGVFIV